MIDLSITKVCRRALAAFHSRKVAATARSRARAAAERQNAARELLADDAAFHGVSPGLLGGEHEEQPGYRAEFNKDWPDDY